MKEFKLFEDIAEDLGFLLIVIVVATVAWWCGNITGRFDGFLKGYSCAAEYFRTKALVELPTFYTGKKNGNN